MQHNLPISPVYTPKGRGIVVKSLETYLEQVTEKDKVKVD